MGAYKSIKNFFFPFPVSLLEDSTWLLIGKCSFILFLDGNSGADLGPTLGGLRQPQFLLKCLQKYYFWDFGPVKYIVSDPHMPDFYSYTLMSDCIMTYDM